MKSSTYYSAAQLTKGQFRSIAFRDMYDVRLVEEKEDEANTAINEWLEEYSDAITELTALLTTVKIVDTYHNSDEMEISDETLGEPTYTATDTGEGYVIGMSLPIVNWKEVANVIISSKQFGVRTANDKIQPSGNSVRPHFSRLVAKKLAVLFGRKEQDFI